MLHSLTLNLSPSGAGLYRLSRYSDVAGQPGVSLGTLFNDTTTAKPPSGDVTFGGLSQAMAPSKNYWIVLSVDAGQPITLGGDGLDRRDRRIPDRLRNHRHSGRHLGRPERPA